MRDDAVTLPLARWRYRGAMDDGREHVGYVLEDAPGIPASDERRGQVDLYGYTSMAVAALQAQQREIDELRAEVRALEGRCAHSDRQ